MKLIISYLKNHLGIFMFSMLFLTMEAVADLLQPTFMSFIVDEGVENADVSIILRYGLIMLLIALCGAVAAVMRNLFASRTSQTIGMEIRRDMYSHVQGLSLENIDKLQPASIITRITNDVSQIQEFINGLMRIMVKAPITGIGAITLIIIRTPRQAPVMGVILVIAGIFIFGNIKIGYPRFGIVQKKLDGLNNVTREFLSSIRVVKAFRAEDEETDKFEKTSLDLAAANTSALRVMAVFSPLISLTVNFGIVLLLWISGSKDASHIGRIMASVNYMTQVLFSLNMISNVINNAVRAMASSERIEEVLREQPSQHRPEHPKTPSDFGAIEFKDVSFTYAGCQRESLSNISISIGSGETIGIIGPTGSGKTTLVNLVPRFYDATEGRITIGGIDVTEISEEQLRENIAIVPQKALLFTGTILENIKWGRETATDDEVYRAAKTACADEFISTSNEGYSTLLGQGGVNLSGGQKQRLSLARALLRNPKVLILDDCTSALDAATEHAVLSGLAELKSGMTVLLISQRISTVMRADRILCLDNGEVRGYGSHNELMQNCETYRNIYDSQIGLDAESNSSSADNKGGEASGK